MTEYVVKIPLDDEVTDALELYARNGYSNPAAFVIELKVSQAMDDLVSAAIKHVAAKKTTKYRQNSGVVVEKNVSAEE